MASQDTIALQDATAVDLELEIAGVGSRSYAFIIDWHVRVLLVLAWAIIVWAWVSNGVFNPVGSTASLLIAFGPMAVFYFLYHPILEMGWSGWTPGKQFANVRIVTNDGRPASVGAHLVRNVFRLIDSLPALYALGLTVCMCHPRQVRIGDLAAGTVLVFEPRARADDLDRAATGVQSSRLTADQHAFVVDLLARWSTLTPARRVALGERFLGQIGEPLPSEQKGLEREYAIRDRLRELSEG
jgi:uncharacterized RDD family membrane protein YckC